MYSPENLIGIVLLVVLVPVIAGGLYALADRVIRGRR